METFFIWPTTTLVPGATAAAGLLVAVFAVIGRRASIVMKLGLRNVPRQPVRAGLIVFGLMLSTTVIGSAFATGDIMTYTLRSLVTDNLGHVDEVILLNPPDPERGDRLRSLSGGSFGGLSGENLYYFSEHSLENVESVAGESDVIAATLPAVLDRVTLVQPDDQQLRGSVMLLAVPTEYPEEFGRLTPAGASDADLSYLANDEVFVNGIAAEEFGIQAGDSLQVGTWANRFTRNGPWQVTVKAIVDSTGLVGAQPALIADLAHYQELVDREDLVNVVLVSNEGGINSVDRSETAAAELRVALADARAARGLFEIMQKPAAQQTMIEIERALDGVARERYSELREEAAKSEMTDSFVSYISEPRMRHGLILLSRRIPDRSDRVAALGHLRDLAALWVVEVKRDGMQEAQQYGNVVTTVFLVLGIFSIGASLMLIVLIFNLLATDRSGELATMRAMGMRRRQIMGVFLFEGLVYNLTGAVLGALAGLASAYLTMRSLAGTLDDFGIELTPRITPESMLLAFSLGMLLTFTAMLVSAWRVSRSQIVAATAGEDRAESRDWLFPLGAALFLVAAFTWHRWHEPAIFYEPRHPLVLPAVFSLVTLGIACWLGFIGTYTSRFDRSGRSSDVLNTGASLLAGLGLILVWLRALNDIPTRGGDLLDDAVMVAIGGLLLVLATIWTASSGIGPALKLADRLTSSAPRLRVLLRPAAGYLGHRRLRTALTIAMFGAIIFVMVASLTLIDALVNAYAGRDAAVPGYEVRVDLTSNWTPADFRAELVTADAVSPDTFSAIGGITRLDAQVVQLGLDVTGWRGETLVAAEPELFEGLQTAFLHRSHQFDSDREVWEALAGQTGLAVVTADSLPGIPSAATGAVTLPYTVWARTSTGGQPLKLTVVGVVDARTELDRGIYVSRETASGMNIVIPEPQTYFLTVAPGIAVADAVDGLRISFATSGLAATDLGDSLRVSRSIRALLTRVVQGYMGLGLVAGIAALGILGVQSVIERRGQLGALRALGFTRRQTCLTLGFESLVIALLGIVAGITTGLILARSLVTLLASRAPEILYSVPWGQITLSAAIAAAGSAVSITLAAWQAGKVSPADALRQ